jgi:hypothetical protein
MAKEGKLNLTEGTVIWLPCEIKQGMFPNERYITVKFGQREGEGITITGFIPSEDVEEHREKVRAVIARLLDNSVALLFRGEIFPTTNPVTVPTKWVKEEAQPAA